MLLNLIRLERKTLLGAVETAKNNLTTKGIGMTKTHNLKNATFEVLNDIFFVEHKFTKRFFPLDSKRCDLLGLRQTECQSHEK